MWRIGWVLRKNQSYRNYEEEVTPGQEDLGWRRVLPGEDNSWARCWRLVVRLAAWDGGRILRDWHPERRQSGSPSTGGNSVCLEGGSGRGGWVQGLERDSGFIPWVTVDGVWVEFTFRKGALETAWRTDWIILCSNRESPEGVLRAGDSLPGSLQHPLNLAWCQAWGGGLITLCWMAMRIWMRAMRVDSREQLWEALGHVVDRTQNRVDGHRRRQEKPEAPCLWGGEAAQKQEIPKEGSIWKRSW